ncbi:hypothetical protein AB0D78_38750 [Streptomyces avermitilis]|uniref:hypothetical protein n=1 Tax=Streptomyces avermitilis TaxID=33903 RepID=UPI00340A19E8
MSIRRGFIGAAAGAVVVLGALTAPAQAAPTGDAGIAALSCNVDDPWSDQNTIGYYCTGNGNVQFRAVALCGNGTVQPGSWRYATGQWSYAYCAGKGGLEDGFLQTR